MSDTNLPIVGIICDREIIGPHPFHIAGDKYIQAIVEHSHCLPVLIPALANKQLIKQLLSTVDGILLTGGYSMVEPALYQGEPAEEGTKKDIHRDGTSLPISIEAIKQGVPLFGICRGFQEINVAFGGSLYQKLHQHEQFIEHREGNELTLSQQYSTSHSVQLSSEGKLAEMLATDSIDVNSLHTQGVERLAESLQVEALAEDGLVEAFSVKGSSTFAMAVQWHPEWQVEKNKHSQKIFQAFGQACLSKKLTRDIEK